MTCEQAMAALKAAGSEPTRKTYARHGIDPARAFGVTYAEIYKLAKQAGQDHALAQKLWSSGNHDARILAANIADPDAISSSELQSWMGDCRNYLLMDAVSTLAMRTPHAAAKARAWIDSREEYIAAGGWNVVAGLAMAGAPEGTRGRAKKPERDSEWDDAAFEKLLTRIERDISSAKNRVKHSMNNALICIGLRGAKLRDAAIAAARRIGKVKVDHGQTGCKTPDAVAYIQKVEARRKPATASAARPAARAPKATKPARRKPASARRG